MTNKIKYNLVDCIFGELIVIEDISSSTKKRKYKCRCIKTGYVKNVLQCDLLSGRVRSLGKRFRHGMAHTSEYEIWEGMIQRCHNEKNNHYKNYGFLGIRVCKRWKKFIYFYLDMGPKTSSIHTIERINGKKGYSPSNCKWATRYEQNRNHSRNVNIEWRGRKMCLTDISIVEGFHRNTIDSHIRRGREIGNIIDFLKNKQRRQRWSTYFLE